MSEEKSNRETPPSEDSATEQPSTPEGAVAAESEVNELQERLLRELLGRGHSDGLLVRVNPTAFVPESDRSRTKNDSLPRNP